MSDPFERSRWNQIQLLVWIQTRDRWLVRWIALTKADHQSAADKAFSRGICLANKHDMDYFVMSFEDAQESAIEKLSNGAFRAWGRKNGRGSREEIPAEEWPGLQFYPDGRVRVHEEQPYATFWTDVLFERKAVLELWPGRQAEANGLQAEMNEWFINVYVTEQAGRIPSRPEAEKAAREKFGPGVRASLRGAWAEHALPSWRKRGPKGLNRKAD